MKLSFDQIKAAYEREVARRAPVQQREQIPLAFEDITLEWLNNTVGDKQHGDITGFTLGPEDEGTSSRRRIELTLDGDATHLPSSLFAKATFTLPSRCLLGMNGAIEAEVRFYNELRPQLNIEAPTARFANFNPDTLNSIILLDDMTGQVSFSDHRTAISEQQAKEQLSILATLHGKYYQSPELTRSLSYLNTWSDFFTITANEAGFGPQADIGFREAQAVIPDRLFKKADKIWPATLASVARHESLPHTVVHSDVHLKNWYITADQHMGLSDWQCMCRGHWGRDLAYVISTSLTTADRRAWEKDLIQYYLAELKASGGAETTFDDAWTYYRQNLFGALAWWTPVLSPNPDVPDMQPRDTSLEFISRMTHAIDDTDALDSF
ncbi:phosphotransferase [Spongiibacter sp. KMU-166]|uniref:Phosphotransferase n=1 Tax=Spongiibacter thalassae TaxID=2721624 RepID=A0ABX1GAE2_9GAMM|nr:phosphotransferase [Spongiibacter thalassae]NKI16129.1 phosphotransferase [Spongiibacter thalassae]